MHVVAGEASNSAPVHDALHKIISLHPVLMRRAIREMREGSLAKGDVFELPIILKVKTAVVPHGPVVSFTLDLFGKGLPL